MITARHRFHGYSGLKVVYRSGLTIRSSQASLKYSWRSEQKPYRAAVVVSRKVHKSAVVRNRIRRRIFEIVRSEEASLPNGLDMAFMIYSDELAELPSEQLHNAVVGLMHKAIAQKPSAPRPQA